MVVCAESGDLRDLADSDRGIFTVQASEVPAASLRRKGRKQKFQRKRARLTPINENEEEGQREDLLESPDSGDLMAPVSITLTSPTGEFVELLSDRTYERSDTPMKKCSPLKLHLDLDTFEEELDNIEKQDTNMKDPEIGNILAELPPRPKCKRKVLPPSITSPVGAEKENLMKKKKLLKLRSKYENKLEHRRYSMSKDLEKSINKETFKAMNERLRPRSAEHGVRVLRLADLSSKNSTSVPDLPTILNRISKANELAELSGRRSSNKTAMYEDSGALSTPREDTDSRMDHCLRGSDMSSFYNMWDRDHKSRPFDKKESDKVKINIHRDCLCSIRNCARKCFNQRNHVLPPIPMSSPSRD